MNLKQALKILDEVFGSVNTNRAGHQQILEAQKLILSTLKEVTKPTGTKGDTSDG